LQKNLKDPVRIDINQAGMSVHFVVFGSFSGSNHLVELQHYEFLQLIITIFHSDESR
jgi:hypothetical protein